jgi:signal recognition particle subunit SRP54
MKQMMSGLGQNLGWMGKVPGMKQMAMAKNMRQMMGGGGGGGGMPGFPGMGMPGMGLPGMGMPGMGFPGMGMPGMGMPGMGGAGGGPGQSLTKMKPLSQTERNAKKAQRKRERDARKKGRK